VQLGLTFNTRSEAGISSGNPAGLADDGEEEFDSLATVQAIADTLASLGHEVELLGDGEPLLRRLLDGPRPDLVFNIAEGIGAARSREARVPAVLEMLGIPYTGSDPLTLAVALDKPIAKQLVAAAGVNVPRGVVVPALDADEASPDGFRPASNIPAATTRELQSLELPLIAKPAFEGSSKGVLEKCLIIQEDQLVPVIQQLRAAYCQPILVEQYISGEELTVGVLGNAPPVVIGVMRIVPKQQETNFIYSLEVKRDWENRVRYECPAEISPAATAAVQQAAISAYTALGCRDLARIDFRLRGDTPYFIEANPLPGLSPKTGDIVLLANGVGVEHRELLRRILEAATARIGTLCEI